MIGNLVAAERLWRSCFNDPDDFVRFYFGEIAREEEIYLYEDAGQAIAHIHAPHYQLSGGMGQAFYISGACTLEDYRGQGIMGALMTRVMQAEYARGCVAALLIPADEALRTYYARHFGFVTNNYLYRTEELSMAITFDAPASSCLYLGQDGTHQVAQFVCSALEGNPTAGVRHTARQAANVFAEYVRWGRVFTATDEAERLRCVALCREDEETLYIDAILGLNPEQLLPLIPKDKKLCLTLPYRPQGVDGITATPRGMVRPLNVMAYAREYAARGGADIAFSWEDDIIPANTGSYRIEDRRLYYEPTLSLAPLSAEDFVRIFVGEYWLALMHE